MQLLTPADAAGRVTSALKSAAQATGAGFDYLARTAKRESALNPAAQNPNSSARGLFQFIDSTWLEVLKEEGSKLGLGDAAASVSKTSSGRYTVQDPARRAELLAMRDDPQAAALVAGAFTRRNADSLTSSLGRAPTEGELYAAHFMGAQGAAQLVSLATASPDANAASAFPAQAGANRAIFFDKGRPRSASEVYDTLTATSAVAPSGSAAGAPAASAFVRTAAAVEQEPTYNDGVEDDRSAFHSLFKTGRRSPVSTYVSQAWSAFEVAGVAAGAGASASARSGASETAAPAYAPQTEAPPARNRTSPAVAAADAVTRAAAAKPRAAADAVPPGAAVAASAKDVAQTPSASAPSEKKPFELVSFLKSMLSAPGQTHSAKAGARP